MYHCRIVICMKFEIEVQTDEPQQKRTLVFNDVNAQVLSVALVTETHKPNSAVSVFTNELGKITKEDIQRLAKAM